MQKVEAPAEVVAQWNDADPLIKPNAANAIRLATLGSVKRMMLTGMNPAFAAANTFRDIAHAILLTNTYSKHFPVALAQITKDFATVSKDALSRGKLYKQFIEDGGGMDFLTTQGRPLVSKDIGKEGLGERTMHVLGYLNETSELLTRLSIYKRNIDEATTAFKKENKRDPNPAEVKDIRLDAAAAARDQMDFSQGGTAAKAIDNFIPYTNAALQGTRVLIRYAKNNPGLFAYKLAQLGAVSMGLAMLAISGYEDDWDDISDDVKARYFIIFLPMKIKGKDGVERRKYLSIAKSHEQAMFAGVFESIAEFVMRGTYPTGRTIDDFQTSLPLINPTQIPLLEAMNAYASGYDTYRERMVNEKVGKIEPWREYTTGKTPEFLINIGKATAGKEADGTLTGGLSPDRMKLAADKIAGTPEGNLYYTLVSKGYNMATEGLGVNERNELDKSLAEHVNEIIKPVRSRFLKETFPAERTEELRAASRKAETSRVDQNDKVRSALMKRKDASPEEKKAIDKDISAWLKQQPEQDRKRLYDRYVDGAKNADTDYWYIILRNTSSPEARAMAVFQESSRLSDQEREKMWAEIKQVGGIRGDRFDAEYKRLKQQELAAKASTATAE